VKLWVWSASGSRLAIRRTAAAQHPAQEDYSRLMNASTWPHEALNIYVKFYETTDGMGECQGYIATVNDTFDSLLGEDLFGFRDITVDTYITSFYVNTVVFPITFALKPDSGGPPAPPHGRMYEIEYEVNNSGNWRPLVGCSWYKEGVKTYKSGPMGFLTTGPKRIQLRARRCGTGIVNYRSYPFWIRHVDLKDALNASTTIVSPIPNSDMSRQWPYGSIADNVYWTQSGNVPLVGFFTTNTEPENPRCGAFYDDGQGVERHIGNYPKTQVGPNAWACDAGALGFATGEWGSANYNSGQYSVIRVSERVVAQPDSIDDINIGIDDTGPTIVSIDPDPNGIMNGIYRWYADITDDLSGIATVDFFLIEKGGYMYCSLGVCWYGDGNLVWSQANVDFNADLNKFFYDLNTLNHPDGDYNVGFGATDIAGNYSYLEVDPIIDNTPPVISPWYLTPADPVRGEVLSFQATVTDNLTGVETVTATIAEKATGREYTAAMPRVSGDVMGGTHTGTIDTNNEFGFGDYNVRITATDFATNISTADDNFELAEGTEKDHNGESVIIQTQFADVNGSEYNDANRYYNFWISEDVNTHQWVKVLMNGVWVELDLNVDGNTDVKIVPDQNIILTIQNAWVTSLSWDSAKEELNITADGEGIQEVIVYVNGNSNPKTITFDGVAIASWKYDAATQTVSFTVDLGSPHTFLISWYVAPTPTPTPGGGLIGGGGGGGSPAYYCGDNRCYNGETYCDCPEDCEAPECGTCEEINCDTGEPVCAAITPCAGNGTCDEGENCGNAPEECPCGAEEECVGEECHAIEEPGPTATPTPEETPVPIATPEEEEAPELDITPEEDGMPAPLVAATGGFFGLGDFADYVAGFLVLVIIIGGIVYIKYRG